VVTVSDVAPVSVPSCPVRPFCPSANSYAFPSIRPPPAPARGPSQTEVLAAVRPHAGTPRAVPHPGATRSTRASPETGAIVDADVRPGDEHDPAELTERVLEADARASAVLDDGSKTPDPRSTWSYRLRTGPTSSPTGCGSCRRWASKPRSNGPAARTRAGPNVTRALDAMPAVTVREPRNSTGRQGAGPPC